MVPWTVEFSDEVDKWYLGLSPKGEAAVDAIVELLEERGHTLRMPHSKPLGNGLFELRFTCEGVARRITYVLDPKQKAVTLTTFRKQKQNERLEVERAQKARKAYRAKQAAEAQSKGAKPKKGKK